MKRLLIIALFFILLSSSGTLGTFGPNLAHAQENAGLLPTNPFYFLKEWRRGVAGLLTIRPAKRAELELQTIREKSLEIKKLKSIDSNQFPLDSYLDDLAERSLRQLDFYFGSGQKTLLLDTIALLPFSENHWRNFREKLEAFLEDKEFYPVLDLLSEIELALPEAGQKSVGQLKEDWLLKLQGAASTDIKVLEGFPKDSLAAVKIIDELREYAADGSDLKNKLNHFRQAILDSLKKQNKIGEPEARNLINAAGKFIDQLGPDLSKNNKAISLLASKAKYNLEQARASYGGENYGDAFSQASLALAAAGRILPAISKTAADSRDDLKKLKAGYDRLLELERKNNKEFGALLGKAEKLLIKSADLLSKETVDVNKVNSYLQEVKVLLAPLETSRP